LKKLYTPAFLLCCVNANAVYFLKNPPESIILRFSRCYDYGNLQNIMMEVNMRKIGIALSVLSVLLLLAMSSCKAETVTVTANTTVTKSATVTQTVGSTVTVTSTVTSFTTSTQTQTSTTIPSTTTPAVTTSSTSQVQVIAETEDGRLQVVSATLVKATIAMYQVTGKVLNTSNEVLTARITIGFITDGGGLDQTQYTLVADIQPGQQKTFTVSSIDTFNNCTDFSILIEVWD
jgi:hypothetical protein